MTKQDNNEKTNAIRYALLQRLIPGIRHGLMGELQAIQSLAELAERQLQASADSAKIRDGVVHIIAHTGNTVGSCRLLAEWLSPTTGAMIAIGAGIRECIKLAGDDWPLRGIEATTHLQAPDAQVGRAALREVFAATLLALIDMHPGTLDIDVESAADGEYIALRFHARSADRQSSMPPLEPERRFTWADVQMLAKAHSVPCSCSAQGATLHLRQVAASAGRPSPAATLEPTKSPR